MAESTLSLAYSDIRTTVSFRAGYSRDVSALSAAEAAQVDDIIKSGLRQFYYPPPVGGVRHNWSFLKPTMSLVLYAEVTGELLNVPVRAGSQYIFTATDDIFVEAHEGKFLLFDDNDYRFKITDYISERKVKVVGDGNQKFGTWVTGVASAVDHEFTKTNVQSTSQSYFVTEMAGANLVFDATANSYVIEAVFRVGASDYQARVLGDAASTESDSDTVTVQTTGTAETIATEGGRYNLYPDFGMYDGIIAEGETVTFSDTATDYTVEDVEVAAGRVSLNSDPTLDGNAEGDAIVFKRAGTIQALTGLGAVATIDATEAIFTADMVGQYLVFESTLNAYEILQRLSDTEVAVDGDPVGAGESGNFAIVQAAGALSSSTTIEYDGSALSTVTAASSVFTSTMEGMTLRFLRTGNKYAIAGYTSGTVVTVVGNASGEWSSGEDNKFWVVGPSDLAAGDTFAMENTGGDYQLPDDFGAVQGVVTYAASTSWKPILKTSASRIRELRQTHDLTGRPELYAVRPLSSDGTQGQRSEMIFWPDSDSTYTVSFEYNAYPWMLSDAKPYPLGGMVHAETILQSCLAILERRLEDAKGVEWNTFMEQLAASIQFDQDQMTAEHLGYNKDESDYYGRRHDRSALKDRYLPAITYTGDG